MNKEIASSRIDYLDSCKGLLILILVAHHIPYCTLTLNEINNSFFLVFQELRPYLYMPFFMTAFFVTTGIYSNFDKPFRDFAKNLAVICIPTYFILRGQHWYVDAFVGAKIMYYVLNRFLKGRNCILCITLLSGLFACIAKDYLPEPFSIYHTLEMLLFVHIGHCYKDKILNNRNIIIASFIYVLLATLYYIGKFDIPWFEYGFHVTYFSYIPFIILSVSGSMMAIGGGKLLNNKLLRKLGSLSLIIFLAHFHILMSIISRLKSFITIADGNALESIALFIGIWIVVVVACFVLSLVLNSKYLSWILGK